MALRPSRPWRRFPNRWGACLTALALLAGGCGSGDSGLVPVAGAVTVGGAPLDAGSVTFLPDASRGNTSQDVPVGTVSKGRYELTTRNKKGAPPGAYKVIVVSDNLSGDNPPPKGATAEMPRSKINPRYGDPAGTPLRKDVTAKPAEGAYDLDLANK